VYLNSCTLDGCGFHFHDYPAAEVLEELQRRMTRLGIDLGAQPLEVFEFAPDSSEVFPVYPVSSDEALVARAADESWTLYLGFDEYTMLGGIRVTDLILELNSPAPFPTATARAAEPAATLTPIHADWMVYHNEVVGYSIEYPITWFVTEDSGTIFELEGDVPEDTNLYRKRMRIAAFVPAGVDCTDPFVMFEPSVPEQVTIKGIRFLKESSHDQSMNSIHESVSYSVQHGSYCISIALLLDWTNVGVYDDEPKPFDRGKESAVFNDILRTFRFDP